MGTTNKAPLVMNDDEEDYLKSPQYYYMRPGQKKLIKRKYRRKERRLERHRLNNEKKEITRND